MLTGVSVALTVHFRHRSPGIERRPPTGRRAVIMLPLFPWERVCIAGCGGDKGRTRTSSPLSIPSAPARTSPVSCNVVVTHTHSHGHPAWPKVAYTLVVPWGVESCLAPLCTLRTYTEALSLVILDAAKWLHAIHSQTSTYPIHE